jgi:hypothetical protein
MRQGFQKVKSIYTLMGTYMKIRWKPLQVHDISSIYNNILLGLKERLRGIKAITST